jgi:hypothetical protein
MQIFVTALKGGVNFVNKRKDLRLIWDISSFDIYGFFFFFAMELVGKYIYFFSMF